MMASIYSGEGHEIAVGLQGSSRCDEAWQIAVASAKKRGEPVYLSDDDGEWVIHPDGSRELDEDSNENDEQ